MAQLSKIDLINRLQKSGLAAWLYRLGVINSRALCYANAYNYMDALEKTGQPRAEAIKLTAAKFKLTRRSVYNIVREMEQVATIPPGVENLVSKIIR